jgi:choline dehydrogenase
VEDQSFEWDSVEPFYKQSVLFTPPGPNINIPVSYDSAAFIPTGGPLQVSYSNYQQPYGPSLAKGLLALGIQSILGFNSGFLNGFASSTITVDPRDATRSSSETSFLRTAIAGSDLQVFQHTMAKYVTFDEAKKASGVLVETNGVLYTLSARKEVIVSAGTVSRTTLVDLIMMLSGYL